MSKDKVYSERIKNLVKLVEEDFSIKRYQWQVTLKRLLFGVIPTLVVIGLVVWVFFIVIGIASSYLAIAETKDAVVIAISITVLAITLFGYINKLVSDLRSSFGELSKEEVTNWNLKRLKESVEKEVILLLKALITMKCKQPDISLEDIYRADDSMFRGKRLVERLYE